MDQATAVRFALTAIPLWCTPQNNEGLLEIEGAFRNVYHTIIERFNLTVLFEDVALTEKDIDYGRVTGPNEGTGMLGYLVKNISDITLYTTPPDYQAFEYVQYSTPHYRSIWTIISMQPIEEISNTFEALRIFHYSAWITILFAMLLVALYVYLRNYLMHLRTKRNNFLKEFIDVLGIAFLQGYNLKNVSSSIVIRTIWMMWFFSIFTIGAMFSGSLLSKLTLPNTLRYFDRLEDILSKPDVSPRLPRDTSIHYFFMNTTLRLYQNVYKQIEKTQGLYDYAELDPTDELAQMQASKQVLITDLDTIKMLFHLLDECSTPGQHFHLSKEDVIVEHNHFMIRRGFNPEIANAFMQLVTRYNEGGIFVEDIRLQTADKPKCSLVLNEKESRTTGSESALNTEHIYLPMMFLVLAFLFSTVYFIMELTFFKPKRKRVQHRRRKFNIWN